MASYDYQRSVRFLAEEDSAHLISCGQSAHAAFLYEVFFERAQREVGMLCKNFSRGAFGSERVVRAFKGAVGRGVRFVAISQETAGEDNPFVASLKQAAKDEPVSVTYRELGGDATEHEAKLRGFSENFCVVDRKAYRWEPDREKVGAIACMNSPGTASSISDLIWFFLDNIDPVKA